MFTFFREQHLPFFSVVFVFFSSSWSIYPLHAKKKLHPSLFPYLSHRIITFPHHRYNASHVTQPLHLSVPFKPSHSVPEPRICSSFLLLHNHTFLCHPPLHSHYKHIQLVLTGPLPFRMESGTQYLALPPPYLSPTPSLCHLPHHRSRRHRRLAPGQNKLPRSFLSTNSERASDRCTSRPRIAEL